MTAGGPIRIGIDGYNLAMARGTGVATYGRTLARAVASLDHPIDLIYGINVQKKVPPELRESLFFGALNRTLGDTPPTVTLKMRIRRARIHPFVHRATEVPVTGRVIARDLADRVPAFDRLFSIAWLYDHCARHFRRFGKFMTIELPNPPAIMHWTYPLPIRVKGARNIYTIHDLVPIRLPHTSLEDKGYYDRLIRRCLADADHIVTVSETSRRDILDLYPIDPDRVTNTYQPVDPFDVAMLDDQALAARLRTLFDLPLRGYFLYFGAIEPKKNIGRLIEAYLASEVATPLVIVGGRGWDSSAELRLLGTGNGVRLPGAERVRQVDFLPRALLMQLVQGAKAVVFPSLYEGFGLPAMEAMALGTPVLTSTAGSLGELARDAAVSVDPYDVGEMTAAIRALDGDRDLRERLRQAGPIRAADFSMARYAPRVEALYRRIAGN